MFLEFAVVVVDFFVAAAAGIGNDLGGTARTAYDTVDMARAAGLKVGLFRPITIWPFADKEIAELAGKVKHIVVAEMNYGQYVREVERAVAGKVPVTFHGKYNNEAITPDELFATVKGLA